ncbi:MAG: hypothetical protein RSF67_10320, partial [Clostridia bacterium]
MSIFSEKFYKKEKLVPRTFEIEDSLYSKLEYLSSNKYEASVNRLVNSAIEGLVKTKDIKIYEKEDKLHVSRSFLIRESLVQELYSLKKKFGISMYILVNIA